MVTRTKTAAKRTVGRRAESGPTLGQAIVQGLREAVAFERGELQGVTVTERVRTARNVAVKPPAKIGAEGIIELRSKLKLSQAVFAQAMNVKPDTIKSWEQGKRVPDGAAVRLLEVAREHPEWVLSRVTQRKSKPRAANR